MEWFLAIVLAVVLALWMGERRLLTKRIKGLEWTQEQLFKTMRRKAEGGEDGTDAGPLLD